MDEFYFMLEEVGYKLKKDFRIEFVDTKDIDYSIERLNVVLVTSGESPVTHYTYGEYMTLSAPIVTVNNRIVCKGEVPCRDELEKAIAAV